MKKIVLSLGFILLSFFAFSQNEDFKNDIETCIELNGTKAYYSQVIDKMFVMLKSQYATKQVADSIWSNLQSIRPKAMNNVTKMLISAYQGHYSHKDIKNMNALYTTEAGKRMVVNPQTLTEKDQKKLNDFYKSQTGQKIVASQESMNKSLSTISEVWSSELYKKAVNMLEEKGY